MPANRNRSTNYSLMVVPHGGGRAKPHTIPRWAVVLGIGLLAVIVIGLGATALYYATRYEEVRDELAPLEERSEFLARKNSEYKGSALVSNSELNSLRIAAERDRLAYERSMMNVRAQLAQLQTFYKNLRIMAGFKLEEQDADELLGRGGPSGVDGPPAQDASSVEGEESEEAEVITSFGYTSHSANEYAANEALLLSEMAELSQDMYSLVRDLESRISTISPDVPYGVPVQGVITSYFGEPRWHGPHKGLDIAAPIGTPVRTPASGVVIEASYRGAYGLTVWIDHGNGYQTRYAHMASVGVEIGQRINAGQVVGAVGVTGATTGPHLHYEVRLNGIALDPVNYLVQ